MGDLKNVHACPRDVGGWSKKVKILSMWFVNDPYHKMITTLLMSLLDILQASVFLFTNAIDIEDYQVDLDEYDLRLFTKDVDSNGLVI